jgi:serine/threonine protein kinase
MSKLSAPVTLQTAFGEYVVDEQLGEGGAGRVYGGVDGTGGPVAIKVLTQTSTDKRGRFKNEIAFLMRTRHDNVVAVIDHGFCAKGTISGPFYVMGRYAGSLRDLMRKKIAPVQVMPFFSQVLDGAECAHLLGMVHRDIKPENVLHENNTLAVADFGIASFTEDQLATLVETMPGQRLANFQYAAPEQRVSGRKATVAADIYALGLILNEMFTGAVPQGTDYLLIGTAAKEFDFLDGIVAQMIKQNPNERPDSIARVKTLIQKYHAEALTLQKLSKIDGTVIKVNEIDEPLSQEPPVLIGVNWNDGTLHLTLDRSVNQQWVNALASMGSYASVLGVGPEMFRFSNNTAVVVAQESDAQQVIDYFKNWLPQATQVLRQQLLADARQEEQARREALPREREAEERRLRVNRNLRV